MWEHVARKSHQMVSLQIERFKMFSGVERTLFDGSDFVVLQIHSVGFARVQENEVTLPKSSDIVVRKVDGVYLRAFYEPRRNDGLESRIRHGDLGQLRQIFERAFVDVLQGAEADVERFEFRHVLDRALGNAHEMLGVVNLQMLQRLQAVKGVLVDRGNLRLQQHDYADALGLLEEFPAQFRHLAVVHYGHVVVRFLQIGHLDRLTDWRGLDSGLEVETEQQLLGEAFGLGTGYENKAQNGTDEELHFGGGS